jgi:hypothetical protein
MEDAIALADELLGARAVDAALAGYEARRRPEVEALQAAAQASLEWFEGTERYLAMAPVQFTYSLMTRSLRVSHASVARRDPHLARGVERLLAASVGVGSDPPPPPTALPLAIRARRARSRIAVAPTSPAGAGPGAAAALIEAARAGAGLVVTPALTIGAEGSPPTELPGIGNDQDALAWKPTVEQVRAHGALIVARIALPADALHHEDRLASATELAALVGFDVVLLDPYAPARPGTPAAPEPPGGEPGFPEGPETLAGLEHLAAAVAETRGAFAFGHRGWVAAAVRDRPRARAAVLGHAAQLVRAGADLLWISAPDDAAHGARLAAGPLADRLRNELRVATAIESGDALLPDLDAAIGAGRADLVVVGQLPDGTRRTA